MPALYATAAVGVAQAANSMANSDSPTASGGSGGPGGYGASQAFSGLGGGIASALNPPQAQTSPGAYSPPSNIGEGYNYIPTGQGAMDQLLQQLIQQSAGAGSSLDAGVGIGGAPSSLGSGATLWDMVNNGGGGFVPGVRGLQTTGQGALDTAGALNASIPPALQQLLAQAFDPQSALYSKMLGDVTNRANVQNAASGLGATPYGANATNTATSNFDIAWQNQQLARALQGIGGIQGLGGAGTTAANLGRAGSEDWIKSNMVIPEAYLGLLGQEQGIQSNQQQLALAPANAAMNYLRTAQPANALSNTVGLAQAQLVGNQNANAAAGLGKGLEGALGSLGGLYKSIFGDDKSGGGSSYSNDPSNYPTATMPAGGSVDVSALEGGGNAGGYF